MAAHRFGLLPRLALGGLLVIAAHLHFPEDSLALHLLLQRAQGLIDVVVTDEHLHFWPDSFPALRKNQRVDRESTRTERVGSTPFPVCEAVPATHGAGKLFLSC
jgi:hypothetical protein